MLTVIIAPVEGFEGKRLEESFGDVECKFVYLQHPLNFNVDVDTKWKLYMYANEELDRNLQESLNVFLNHGDDFDYFSIYSTQNFRCFVSPRLFKKEVAIAEKLIYPKHAGLKSTFILDGFIICR